MLNNNSRKKNIILSSSFGVIEQLIVYLMAFVYRTVFLYTLSKNYLGITGLFSNVLQVFSLAELGIGGVIAYRMYEPMKYENKERCAALLNFYRTVYFFISLIILIFGIAFFPFLSFLIADTNDVPSDVNLNLVYWLFVIQNVASYLCVYRQSLLSADQKNYTLSIANIIYNIASNIIKIVFLLFTRNYTLVLIIGIFENVVYNIILSLFIKFKYKEITLLKSQKLDKSEKKQIFKDTGAMMCHKIGYTLINGTDNLILSKFIGITVVGMYSNYALISGAIDTILNKLLGTFVPTIGNICIGTSDEYKYDIYKKLSFINLWLASFCSISYFVLINPFIIIWLDESFLLPRIVSFVISFNIFFNSSRIINSVFINATGLFVKDKIIPLIQSILNLIISIVLVKKIGISGIFFGTGISIVCTVWWRQGVLLYKNIFHKNIRIYFKDYLFWTLLTFAIGCVVYLLCNLFPINLWWVILRFAICIVGINVLYIALFCKTKSFQYFWGFIKEKIFKRRGIRS